MPPPPPIQLEDIHPDFRMPPEYLLKDPVEVDHQTLCGNWCPDSPEGPCQKIGTKHCRSCSVVVYCGRECQLAHWSKHRIDCKSPLLEPDWIPLRVREGGPDPVDPVDFNETREDLMGDMPAIDLLQLSKNEGEFPRQESRILCAVSTDLRNVVKTITSLPRKFLSCNAVMFHINGCNQNPSVMARNIIIALLAFTCPGRDQVSETAEAMIHIWYSAFVRQSDIDRLNTHVLPCVRKVCEDNRDKPTSTVITKTMMHGSRSLRVQLTKGEWLQLLSYMKTDGQLTLKKAREARQAVTLAPQRSNFWEARMNEFQGSLLGHRICLQRFREDGLVLPFYSPFKSQFTRPNPTMFYAPRRQWTMSDSTDPVDGWDLAEVLRVGGGLPPSDRYGKLLLYLRKLFHVFLHRLFYPRLRLRLTFVNVAYGDLPDLEEIQGTKFTRIDTSILVEGNAIGNATVATLATFSPMLQRPSQNPHATIITLYVNSVINMIRSEYPQGDPRRVQIINQIKPYLPKRRLTKQEYILSLALDPERYFKADMALCRLALPLFLDNESMFQRFLKKHRKLIDNAVGIPDLLIVKDSHTIVEKWPFALRIPFNEEGYQEEFETIMGSRGSGVERYVEWKYGPGAI